MLTFRLLGQIQISVDETPVVAFRNRKDIALLVYLAQTGKAQQRDFLADLLWDTSSPKQAGKNLRSAIARLRKQIPEGLVVTRQTVMIAPEHMELVDSSQLLTTLGNIRTVDSAEKAKALEHALATYTDEFLEGFELDGASQFNEWVATTRANIHRQVLATYRKLGAYATDAGDIEQTIAIARHWLAVDETDEAAHVLLIRSLIAEGNKTDALSTYERAVEILRSQLHVEPSIELTALINTIRPNKSYQPPVRRNGSVAATSRTSLHNLPAQYDQFFGRKKIQKQINDTFEQPWCRLITIVGQGGVGKSRLSTTIGRERLEKYPDGVWFVGLADVDPEDEDLAEAIAIEVAITLNMRLKGGDKPIEQVLNFLEHKQMLLILDNFEHVLGGAQFVLDVVERCDRVQMLVTTREALDLRAEWTIDLDGLNYQEDGLDGDESDAVALFMTRQAQRTGGVISAEDRIAIRSICRMVEGLPLAIELAAVQTRRTPVQTIAQQMQADFGSLTSLMRDVPLRHSSLYVVFEMSWQTLSPSLQGQLARLSVFRGGFTAAAASAIAEATQQDITALADKSLLFHDVDADRYALHAVIREFSAEKLSADSTLEKHADYFLALLAQHSEPLQKETPQHSVNLLKPDIENMRLAWQIGLVERKISLLENALPALSVFYQLQGLAREAVTTMYATLDAAMSWGQEAISLAACAGLEQARFQNRLGQYVLAGKTSKAALDLAKQCENEWAVGMGYVLWGESLWRRAKYESAESRLNQALEIGLTLNNSSLAGWANHHLGIINDIQSHFDKALSHLQIACEEWRLIGNIQALSNSLNSMSVVYLNKGESESAKISMEEALKFCTQADNRHLHSILLMNLSNLAIESDSYAEAMHYLPLSLESAISNGDLYLQGAGYLNMGKVLLSQNQTEAAEKNLQTGIKILREIGQLSNLASGMITLARVKRKLNDFESAKNLLTETMAISRQNDFQSAEYEALIGLAELFEDVDVDLAIKHSAEALQLAKTTRNSGHIDRATAIHSSLIKSAPVNEKSLS